MKTKKIISLIVSMMILFTSMVVSAAKMPPKDSESWTNMTDSQADRLLTSQKESFVFIFYRDNCMNSSRSIPNILEYATKNNMSLCGLNANEYPNWMTWSQFLEKGKYSIGFPYIIAYNAEEDLVCAKDNVFTVKEFEGILEAVNMLPGSSAVPNNENKSLFEDVEKGSPYYEAVTQLVKDEVLTGYGDGFFKPEGFINRAEAATVIAREANLKINTNSKSTFSDVDNGFWGKDYIMAAHEAGIINGMGDGTFAPQNKVTVNQIIKMIVCMAGLEEVATEYGGWPFGYVEAANANNIISNDICNKIKSGNYGDGNATRGQVAQWVYNSRSVKNGDAFIVAGKKYELGMSESELGEPDEKLNSTLSFSWYVYGTDTYKDFFALGVMHGEVVAIAASGVGFEYRGYHAGDTLKTSEENISGFLLDKNDGNIIHGVFLSDGNSRYMSSYNLAGLEDESKMNFHFTNAFRVYHKLSAFKWDDNAAQAARLHSEDMANNKYFNHTGLDGRNMGDRMRDQGVNWTGCAENIAQGYPTGVEVYNGWVNSAGHRKNMLGDYTYLGVGFAYNEYNTYEFCTTQNFYSRSSAFDSFFN